MVHSREVLEYKKSQDPKASQVGIGVRMGMKWKALAAESCL